MSHLGRPKGGPEEKYSLKHILSAVETALGTKVQFASDCIGEEAERKAAGLKAGEVLLLENLRFYKEEEKGDKDFAKKIVQTR
ncbi:phosphoglycerate kinase [Algoriphagus boritolerans]|uniref:phosphoglycerate kinase n=1 Tax=Algoriphagus boritolerans TaxID=308111 RepID=UPI003A100CB8